jgi:RHS repeat-associated protein
LSIDSSLELTYDGTGSLLTAQVGKPGKALVVGYTMDGIGRRVGKQVGGKFARAWLYQDALHPVSEVTTTGIFSHFVYAGGGAPTFMLRGGVPFRFIKDHLGSVRLVVNAATGAVAQRLEYDEFGRVLQDTAPGFQPFGFAGGLYDPDTGLVHFGARDYDPEIGRWVNKDPIGFQGGPNLYAYCGNDPINNVDPTGTVIQTKVGEDSLLMMRASEWLFQNSGKEWGKGNYGTAALDGAAGVATFISGVLSAPGMEFVGGPMGIVTKTEVAAVKAAIATETKLAAGSFTPLVEGGGLMAHEGATRGHTLLKHVGMNSAGLDARIADEGLKTASSFVSRAEAEVAGSAVMGQNSGKIANWVSAGAKGKLQLDGAFSGGIVRIVGGYDASATGARFVLRGNGNGGYFILTGFPTP